MVNKGFSFKIITTISIIYYYQVPSSSKSARKRDAAPSELLKFGGKFKLHNKALDSLAFSGHVELKGNGRFTFGFPLLKESQRQFSKIP